MQAVQPDIFALIETPFPGGLARGDTSAAGFDFAAIFSSLAASLEIGLEDRTAECVACAPLMPAFPALPPPGDSWRKTTAGSAHTNPVADAVSTVPQGTAPQNPWTGHGAGLPNPMPSAEPPAAPDAAFPAAAVRVADLLEIALGPGLEYGNETGPVGPPENNTDTPPHFPTPESAADGKIPSRDATFPLFSGLARAAQESLGAIQETPPPVSRSLNPHGAPVRITQPSELLEPANPSRPEHSPILRFSEEGSNPAVAPGIPGSDGSSGTPDRGAPFRQGEFAFQTGSPESAPNPAALLGQAEERGGETGAVRHTAPTAPEVEQGVMDQTVRAARFLLSRDGGTVRLVLDPPELGVIRVHLEVSGNRARTWIETESSGTRDLLLETVPRLRRSLEHQSIHLESVSVRGDGGRHAGGFSHPGSSAPHGGGSQGGFSPAQFGHSGESEPGEGTAEVEETNGGANRLSPGPNGWDLLA